MKNPLVLLLVFSCLVPTTFAAPPPSEVADAKEKALLHVTGSVTENIFIRDLSEERSYPSQTREFSLVIEAIHNQKEGLNYVPGNTVKIQYTFIPKRVNMNGPAKVDVTVGDQIEIWLDKEDDQWISSVSGNTINHMIYVEDRPKYMKEPAVNVVKMFLKEYLPLILVSSLVIFVFVLFLFGWSNSKRVSK